MWGHEIVRDTAASAFAQQLLNDPFAFVVRTLAVVVVANSSFPVSDVRGRPVVVAERLPDRIVRIERDRILDPHLLRGLADVVDVALERELGRVDADHDQAIIRVLLRPRTDIAERAEPVDAGVRPEIDEGHLSAQVRGRERRRIEPPGRPVEPRHVTLDGQVGDESSRGHG